jgi:hypothetical protein
MSTNIDEISHALNEAKRGGKGRNLRRRRRDRDGEFCALDREIDRGRV